MEILHTLAMIMIKGSPFVFVTGLIVTVVNKDDKKYGLYMILGSVIIFIIGFGICLGTFSSKGFN